MLAITPDETDVIVASFNIGVGSAATALSEMIGREVRFSIPDLKLCTRTELINGLQGSSKLRATGVRERFDGECSGNVLLLFPENRSLELVRLLIQEDEELDFLTEMEQEALVEVDNIILNACLSTIADMMNIEIVNQIPTAMSGLFSELLGASGSTDDQDLVMCINMAFSVAEVDIGGQMVFTMDVSSLDVIRRRLGEYFGLTGS